MSDVSFTASNLQSFRYFLLLPVVIHKDQPEAKHDDSKWETKEALLIPEAFKHLAHTHMKPSGGDRCNQGGTVHSRFVQSGESYSISEPKAISLQ